MNEEPFYIGYLPKAPEGTASFVRRVVIATFAVVATLAVLASLALPYFGAGQFEFGRPREFRGNLQCETAPRLIGVDADYLLVGYGKHAVAPEICGASGREVTLRGTLIQRDGRQLIEVAARPNIGAPAESASEVVSLGRFTLRGEIVDSKCYFGVMNPAEGRLHRACAELCLRGGIPAVFVARDRAGRVAHLLIAGPDGRALDPTRLRWVGEAVEGPGEVVRQGKWLVWRIDPAALRRI